jgi:hypothetical protein
MALVGHIGFDQVARHHFIQLGALIDMNPMHIPISILDGIVLSLDTHQGSLDRIFRQALFMVGLASFSAMGSAA